MGIRRKLFVPHLEELGSIQAYLSFLKLLGELEEMGEFPVAEYLAKLYARVPGEEDTRIGYSNRIVGLFDWGGVPFPGEGSVTNRMSLWAQLHNSHCIHKELEED